MITVTPGPGVDALKRAIEDAKDRIAREVPQRLDAFGEETVTQITDQPPYGHPPGGPHPETRAELPVFGRHAYIDRTGQLTHSITSHLEGDSRVRVQAAASYAEDVEYGTPSSRPYPYFWPVIWEREPLFGPFVGEAIVEALEAARE